MKVNMQKIIAGIVFLSVSSCFANKSYNNLQSIFHHRATQIQHKQKASCDLQLGNLIFYFTQDPIMNKIPTVALEQASTATHKEVCFFFPHAQVKNGGCRKMIHQLPQHNEDYYILQLTEEKKPIPGLSLKITYDPTKIVFYHARFNPMQQFKGVSFRFYDKGTIDQMQAKSDTMLQVASAETPPSIVIDCGHGGRDTGAVVHGVPEKKIALATGKQLAKLLDKAGYNVLLTRNKDVFIPLDGRTTFANTRGADLFVSLHANYAHRKGAAGIETFYIPERLLDYSSTHFSDNATQRGLSRLVAHKEAQRVQASKLFAQTIQRHMLAAVKKKHFAVVDRRVKCKPLQVLLGTTMPAALVELGFLSNLQERKLLQKKGYQSLLAKGIYQAINAYFKSIA